MNSLSWSESCLIQDEPEADCGFSHKMSLKEKAGMLGIDSPHGRYQTDQLGADEGIRGRRRLSRVPGRKPGREVRLPGAGAAASGLPSTGPGRQRTGQAVFEPADGVVPRPADASDRGLCREGIGDGGAVS